MLQGRCTWWGSLGKCANDPLNKINSSYRVCFFMVEEKEDSECGREPSAGRVRDKIVSKVVSDVQQRDESLQVVKTTRGDFLEYLLCSVWSCLISKIALCRLKTCRLWVIHRARSPNLFSDFQEVWARWLCPKAQTGATKENNQILAVLSLYSVVAHPSPCWLSDCTGPAWGYMRGLWFVCVTAFLSLRLSFLLLVRDLPSVRMLISTDLSNLELLYPISLITQTLSFPHLLYANEFSCSGDLALKRRGGRGFNTWKTLLNFLTAQTLSCSLQAALVFMKKWPVPFVVTLIYSYERWITQLPACLCRNLHHLPKGKQINEYSHLIYSPRHHALFMSCCCFFGSMHSVL